VRITKESLVRHLILLLPVLLVFQNCGGPLHTGNGEPLDIPLPQINGQAKTFASCDEFTNWRTNKLSQYQSIMASYRIGGANFSQASDSAAGASQSASTPTITNIQEAGVDEPDILKADGSFLYFVRSRSVEIIAKSTLKVVQSLPLSGMTNAKLLLSGDRLMVLGARSNSQGIATYWAEGYGHYLKTFKKTQGQFVEENSRFFAGTLVNARLYGGQVTMVLTNHYNHYDNDVPVAGQYKDVPCAQIQYPLIDDFDFTMTAIHKVAVDGSRVQSLGMPGQANHIYMSANHLYILASGYSWFSWDSRRSSDLLWQSQVVLKLDVSNENLRYLAAGAVLGYINNVWSVKEMGDRFYMATSYRRNGVALNRLWTLEQRGSALNLAGKSVEFGETENIRSVRYIADKAYIVTFRNTDPLFTFELSGGPNPKLLGHLEIPGFSAYLHPVGNNLLFGVGFAGQGWNGGLQLSLFDLQNPANVKALQQTEYGGAGSSAMASYDHHAFYFADGVAALPVTLYKTANTWPKDVDFSGAMFLSFAGEIKVLGGVSHSEWIPEQCKRSYYHVDVVRVTKIGRYLVSVSPVGIKASDPAAGYATVQAERFTASDSSCGALYY
jgi:uncharacterized secreted protein with C-terminal beta-propeller domain